MKIRFLKPASGAGVLALFYSGVIFAETKAPAVASSPMASSPMVIAQVLIGLAVVTALILVFAWLAKRIGYGGFLPQKNMRVISCLMLGHREKAVLVQVGDTQMLLGVAPGRVSMLHTFEQAVVDPGGEGEGNASPSGQHHKMSDFSRYLKEVLKSGPSR